jgi:shikimate kinase
MYATLSESTATQQERGVTIELERRYHYQKPTLRDGSMQEARAVWQIERGTALNHSMDMFTAAAELPRRIAVVGVSGSGKTTLARQLAARLGLAHVELDALYWEPGWTPAQRAVFRERAAQVFQGEAWVVDGNHPEVRDIIWSRADMAVWLDYSLPLVMWRLTHRTFRRCASHEELWNGNQERSLRAHFFSRKSIFLWALRTYKLRRREYPALFDMPEYAHVRPVHLRSPRATQIWFEHLPAPVNS